MTGLWVFAATCLGAGVALAQPTGSIVGFVREDVSGRPLPGVAVVLPAHNMQVETDSSGRYVVRGIPGGPTRFVARKIGWEEHASDLTIAGGVSREYNIALRAAAATLDTIRVVGMSPENRYALNLFAEHRKRGMGTFIDTADLRRREIAKVADLLRTIAGVNVITPPLCKPHGSRTINCSTSATKKVAVSSTRCAMRVVLDRLVLTEGGPIFDLETARGDMRHDWTSAYDIASLNANDLIAVEVYRRENEAPADYRVGGTECGLIQLWTNRR